MARVPVPSQEQWRKAGRWLVRGLVAVGAAVRVFAFVLTGLIFVFAVALLISIIQFQIRIIEAKSQSKNFSLTSMTQSVEMQRDLVSSIKTIQTQGTIISEFEQFQNAYGLKIIRIAETLCRRDPDRQADGGNQPEKQISEKQMQAFSACVTELGGALNMAAPATIDMIERHIGPVDKLPAPLKTTATDAIELTKERVRFHEEHGKRFTRVRVACFVIGTYGPHLAISFARGYMEAAQGQCFPVLIGFGSPTAGSAAAQPAAPQAAPKTELENDLAGALFFDLIAYYRFYEMLFTDIHRFSCNLIPRSSCAFASGGELADEASSPHRDFGADFVEQIVIAPIDITFVTLVIICGALGAMLRITGEMYKPELFGKDTLDWKKTTPLYYFVIGIMCALIVYILAKTVFAGLADTTYVAKSGNMSPFVIAFLAIVSGLLCEEAFQRIIGAGRAALARSTGEPKSDK